MARSRNIKPGLYKNEDLAECSVWARYIFPGLWMLADREGRLEDRPKRIKGELLPFDAQDVEPLLAELAARGFLVRYRNSDGSFIQISKFSAHQTPHYSEKPSVIKPPELQESRLDEEQQTPRALQEDSKKEAVIKRGSQPPDSLIPDSPNPDSLIPEKSIGASRQPAPQRKKSQKSALPADFAVSARVRAWAIAKGFDRLEEHCESFKLKCAAKGYENIDWDAAFMEAIREDWAKLRGGQRGGAAPAPVKSLLDVMDERERQRAAG